MNELSHITSEYKRQFIEDIMNGMTPILDNNQLIELNRSLNQHTNNLTITENPDNIDLNYEQTNNLLIKQFIKNKRLKGLSKSTITYYETQLGFLNDYAIKSFIEMTADDLKEYLRYYKNRNNCSNVSVNNVRRILSSFYKWMEIEDKIILNPMKRIPRIKTAKKVKKALTDNEVEEVRQILAKSRYPLRNSAIFELLLSSGLRVSELVGLQIDDISLVECKGICMGKGQKERIFYFSERAKVLIEEYLEQRTDNKKWLFVQGYAPFNKLGVSGLETMIREEGQKVGVSIHPHKLRRTLSTRLIRKGMPLEQVSKILGHESLTVTMNYIENDKELLKLTHKKHTN